MQSGWNYRSNYSRFEANCDQKQLNLIPHRFKVDLPDDLIMEVVKAKDNDAKPNKLE